MSMKLGMENYVLNFYKVYINEDPELTLIYTTIISKLAKPVCILIVGPGERLQDHWSSGQKRGIQHDFPFITEASGFQHFPRDFVNVN